MTDTEENQRNVLNEPLHGIVIPTALCVVGSALLSYMSSDCRILLAIPGLLSILAVKAFVAYNRKQSVFKNKWSDLELEDQTLISKNSAIYRFKLKTHLESLNIPAGHYVAVKVSVDGVDEVRYYNPINPRIDQGHLDLLVKSYPDGKVSKVFAALQPGETVAVKGPIGNFNYAPNCAKEIAMVVGGSGITPALQILNDVITVPEDLTKVSLLYANNTENDILLKDEIDEIAQKYPNFKVEYVLREPDETWPGEVGVVSKEMMQRYLPAASDDNRLIICGPPAMEASVLTHAKELGWNVKGTKSNGDDQVFVFN